MKAIIVHGGAGAWPPSEHRAALDGVTKAARAGYQLLEQGGAALDACQAAVMALEDNPLFNAGAGSVLTLDGACETDAAIMRGSTLAAGAVAALRGVKNPIAVARKVMEETNHVLLAGEGAERFARTMGFPDHDPVTPERRRQWELLRAEIASGKPRHSGLSYRLLASQPKEPPGTVGCVALDASGEIVAGTSTGGVFMKLPGRVGDTPLLGAGTYASPAAGASATGLGEGIIKTLLSFRAVDAVASGLSPQEAAQRAVDLLTQTLGVEAGIIVLARDGRWGIAQNTPTMPVAVIAEGLAELLVRI
jgi:beta-aspartyl-peptidase (threonine type)